jgi:hypothetical protein
MSRDISLEKMDAYVSEKRRKGRHQVQKSLQPDLLTIRLPGVEK